MKLIKKLSYMLLTGVALVAAASCSDVDDEILSNNFARSLQPSTVEAKLTKEDNTKVRLSQYYVSLPDQIVYNVEECLDSTVEESAREWKKYATYNTSVADIYPQRFNGNEMTEKNREHKQWADTLTLKQLTHNRISIVSKTNGKESKPFVVYISTKGEQIFKNVSDNDRTSNTITVNWKATNDVTNVKITHVSNGVEELIEDHELTAGDKAAAKYTFAGLKPDTSYKIYIYNGETQRGELSVRTFPLYTSIEAGNNVDLQAYINAAEDGDVLMLMPAADGTSEFTFKSEDGTESGKVLVISKNITISCLKTQPVVVKNVSFSLGATDGSVTANDLTIENIKFVGRGSDIFFNFYNAVGSYTLKNVEVQGYKNFAVDPGDSQNTTCELLSMTDCYVHDGMSGRFVDFQKKLTGIKQVTIKQCTFASICNGQDFLRFDYAEGKMPTVLFQNNNMYKVGVTASKGIFYIRSNAAGDKAYEATVKNNIFEECDKQIMGGDAKVDGLDFVNNYYFKSDGLLDATQKAYDANGKNMEASSFKDASNGDFTIVGDAASAEVGNTNFSFGK